jgi:hypothetical protein
MFTSVRQTLVYFHFQFGVKKSCNDIGPCAADGAGSWLFKHVIIGYRFHKVNVIQTNGNLRTSISGLVSLLLMRDML